MNANNVDTAYKPKQYWFYCQTACNIRIISTIKKFVHCYLAENAGKSIIVIILVFLRIILNQINIL